MGERLGGRPSKVVADSFLNTDDFKDFLRGDANLAAQGYRLSMPQGLNESQQATWREKVWNQYLEQQYGENAQNWIDGLNEQSLMDGATRDY